MVLNIFKFAWRNMNRNRRRTFFTLLAIAVGVMCLIFARSYISGLINHISDTMIDTQLGHVRIAHQKYLDLERILPKDHLVPDADRLERALYEMPEVIRVDSRIKFNVLLNHQDNNEGGVAVGIHPEIMDQNIDFSKTIIKGRYFNPDGSGLIIGNKLAEKLAVGVGDELLLVTTDINYSTYALPFKISGIFETGAGMFDKFLVFIPIEKAATMLDCGTAVHELMVFTKDRHHAVQYAEKIKKLINAPKGEQISVIPWQRNDLMKSLPNIIQIYDKIIMIIMFIVALVILNTMLMAVMERYYEIGVIKAMGLKSREVFLMIVTEAFMMGIIGSVIGAILGGGIASYLEKTGINIAKLTGGMMDKLDIPIPFFGKVLYPEVSTSIIGASILFGILVSLMAVLYPAFKSSRMKAVDAFRSNLSL